MIFWCFHTGGLQLSKHTLNLNASESKTRTEATFFFPPPKNFSYNYNPFKVGGSGPRCSILHKLLKNKQHKNKCPPSELKMHTGTCWQTLVRQKKSDWPIDISLSAHAREKSKKKANSFQGTLLVWATTTFSGTLQEEQRMKIHSCCAPMLFLLGSNCLHHYGVALIGNSPWSESKHTK